MNKSKQYWWGMEKNIAHLLRTHDISFVSEQDGSNSPHYPNSSLEPDSTAHDFLLTGIVPTFIEVKYTRLGNIQPVIGLVEAAANAFHRFKFILIIVGKYSHDWDAVKPWVSETYIFNHLEINQNDVENHAKIFIENILENLDKTTEITSNHLHKLFKENSDVESLQTYERAFHIPTTSRLFGNNVSQALEVITASFCSIVGNGVSEMSTVERELGELTTEFTSTHFTSCALRLGRCLELSTYAFAIRIGISSQSGQFECIAKVQDRLGKLDAAMQEMSQARDSGDSDSYRKKKRILGKAIIETQASLSALLLDIDQIDNNERVIRGPDNIQAILRRAQKQLVNQNASLEAKKRLGQIIKFNRAKDILIFRNKAAHGDPDLQTRELSREDVVGNLHKLMEYVLDLSNVVDSI
jgi:hypothetical protein